jgi:hypothetical protein
MIAFIACHTCSPASISCFLGSRYSQPYLISSHVILRCTEHANKEYQGQPSGDENDEMCVKVKMARVTVPADTAERVREMSLTAMKPRNRVIFEN